jgi:hypothetical protein
MTPRAATAAARRAAWAMLAACVAATGWADGPGLPADSGGRPLPLQLEQGTAAPAPAPRPLADWRLLAATGAVVAAVAALRFRAGRRAPPLPPDVFEVLGTGTLGGAHAVRIVRFGPKTLLVGVSATGATTLAEIADPQATSLIVTACREGGRAAGGPPRGTAIRTAAPPVSGEAA